MISFEKFDEYINEFKELEKKEDALNDALRAFSPDFGGFYLESMHELFPKMLAELTYDSSDWISYYIYELNWGNDWKEGMVIDKDGNDIPLKTTRDLYNLLLEEFNEELYKEADYHE